ncbi:hypothetical protein FOL47_010315 [Perkinsus chesapeaki]|uniref:Uncharacterized protein n=1 Tax=Perkinsus chesapeaki TaxID=330153 RepID=A0A7J6L2D7_PERCH|nr:hypothetical protein FOL47_010315 [Perkinsus chesapeaki]
MSTRLAASNIITVINEFAQSHQGKLHVSRIPNLLRSALGHDDDVCAAVEALLCEGCSDGYVSIKELAGAISKAQSQSEGPKLAVRRLRESGDWEGAKRVIAESLRCDDIMKRHKDELDKVEKLIQQRHNALLRTWDRYMVEFEVRAFAMLNRVKQRHMDEMDQLEARESQSSRYGLALSTERRDMEKQFKAVCNIEDFDGASRLQGKLRKLRQRDEARAAEEVGRRFHRKIEQLVAQHSREIRGAVTKIERERSERLRQREKELNELAERSSNLRQFIQRKHELELKRAPEELERFILTSTSGHVT